MTSKIKNSKYKIDINNNKKIKNSKFIYEHYLYTHNYDCVLINF